MDKDMLQLVEQAVSEGIRSHLWFVLIGLSIASAVGVFVGAALKKGGEMFVAQRHFDELLNQIERQTKATESIKADIQNRVDKDNERFKAEFTTYKELWGLLMYFRRLGSKVVELNKRDEPSDDLIKFERSAEALLVCLETNTPFFADEIRHELEDFRSDLKAVVERSQSLPPKISVDCLGVELKGSPIERVMANIELTKALKLLNKERLDRICKLIRERVGFV